MRRKASTISILFVFLLLQYGKVATYIYCKWQAEVVQQLKDCGCESHLTEMFSTDSDHGISPVAIKEVVSDYTFLSTSELNLSIPIARNSHFAEYDSLLFMRSITPAFRPPSA